MASIDNRVLFSLRRYWFPYSAQLSIGRILMPNVIEEYFAHSDLYTRKSEKRHYYFHVQSQHFLVNKVLDIVRYKRPLLFIFSQSSVLFKKLLILCHICLTFKTTSIGIRWLKPSFWYSHFHRFSYLSV